MIQNAIHPSAAPSALTQPPALIDILAYTPLWAWAVLVILLAVGFRRMRDQTTSPIRMLLFPAVMAGLTATGLTHLGLAAMPAALAGLAAGLLAGWFRDGKGATRRLADGRVWIRGDVLAPVQMLAVFAVHYVINAAAALDPALVAGARFQMTAAALTGFLAALFIGRSAARLRHWWRAAPLPS